MHEQRRLHELVELQREERFLEYKRSMPWDELKLKIAKTAMAMANTRDGGTIVIGVRETNGSYLQEGMSETALDTYDADDVQAFVNRFADPYITLELHRFEVSGKRYLAIVVHEFSEVPVVCSRNSGTELRAGAIYTRSYRMAETCEVQSQTEMREIVELATDKAVRRFLERLQRLGLLSLPRGIGGGDADAREFERQLEGL